MVPRVTDRRWRFTGIGVRFVESSKRRILAMKPTMLFLVALALFVFVGNARAQMSNYGTAAENAAQTQAQQAGQNAVNGAMGSMGMAPAAAAAPAAAMPAVPADPSAAAAAAASAVPAAAAAVPSAAAAY